jgi:hypothetical protein
MVNTSYQPSGSAKPFPAIEASDGNYYPLTIEGALDSLGNLVSSTGGENLKKYGFSKVIASGIDPDMGTVIVTGAGQTVSQSASNLVLAAGTTINAETIIRLSDSVSSEFTAQINSLLSQRVANNNFFFELVDVIGDGLAITIVNATTVTVTIPNNSFTTQNIGQSMYLGAYVGTGVFVPGRYAINAVAGNVVTFTVSGFTAGVGTCSAFGWNYHQLRYQGVTATNADYDTQRNGWNTGFTAATINTTASPGHIAFLTNEQSGALLTDALAASSGVLVANTQRASRNNNVPFGEVSLRVQIRMMNGTVAPTATTWTINLVELRKRNSKAVSVKEIDICNSRQPLPVVLNNPSAVTVNSGTITTVTGVTTVAAVTNAGTPAVPATQYSVNSLNTTNGALILTGTSGLQAFFASNIGATVAYVKLYNKATAPTVGTDVPLMVIPVPAAVGTVAGFVELTPGFNGYRFPLGLGIAITGLMADSDTTAVAAGQIKVQLSRTV